MRNVAQGSYTAYPGEHGEALDFNHLTQLGGGLELDLGKYDGIITRAALLGSYVFGERVSGFGVGLTFSWW